MPRQSLRGIFPGLLSSSCPRVQLLGVSSFWSLAYSCQRLPTYRLRGTVWGLGEDGKPATFADSQATRQFGSPEKCSVSFHSLHQALGLFQSILFLVQIKVRIWPGGRQEDECRKAIWGAASRLFLVEELHISLLFTAP